MGTPSKAALRAVEIEDVPKLGVDYTSYSTEEQGAVTAHPETPPSLPMFERP